MPKSNESFNDIENMIFIFSENNKVILEVEDEGKLQGTWEFDSATSILSLSITGAPRTMTMLMLDIDEKTLRCMGFDSKDRSDGEEVTMTKITDK